MCHLITHSEYGKPYWKNNGGRKRKGRKGKKGIYFQAPGVYNILWTQKDVN